MQTSNMRKRLGMDSTNNEAEPFVPPPSDVTVHVDDCASGATRRFCSNYSTDVPEVAQALRHVSWNDSFYEQRDPDFIAAFDYNIETMKNVYLRQLGAYIFLFAFSLWFSFGTHDVWIYLINLQFTCLLVAMMACKEIIMLRRRHVAITSRGVCFDETDEPNGLQVARRHLIKFESIRTCHISETGWIFPLFQLAICIKKSGTAPEAVHTISGISNGQAFVDLVMALVETTNLSPDSEGIGGGVMEAVTVATVVVDKVV